MAKAQRKMSLVEKSPWVDTEVQILPPCQCLAPVLELIKENMSDHRASLLTTSIHSS
jgi:hypothetical protein